MNITFAARNCNATFGISEPKLNFNLPKPMICPVCGVFQDGVVKERKLFIPSDDRRHGVVQYQCTHCAARYLVTYDIEIGARRASFGAFYPTVSPNYENESLNSFSPRFITAYNQALRAESNGDIELAAIGFRQALECLVKDFAINILHKPREEVAGKTLFNAIGDYLHSDHLLRAADVVRILGNDYAHYERRYPEHDFALLKKYMELFINLVESQYMINNPPVAR